MRKGWIIAIGTAVTLLAVTYGASPYVAVRAFIASAKAGDTEKLAAAMDFPAVRASLKPQLAAAVTARMEHDPQIRGTPLAGLGMMLMPKILDRMTDSVVTPDGIATLVGAGKVGHSYAGGGPSRQVDYSYGYAAINRFDVTMRRKGAVDDPATLTFERRGLFFWKLVRIALPQSLWRDPIAAPPAAGDPADSD
jgi:hypothetical protein